MNDIEYVSSIWQYAEQQESKLLQSINRAHDHLCDDIQMVMDRFLGIELTANLPKKEIEYLQRQIDRWKDRGYDSYELKLLMQDMDNRYRIKGNDALYVMLLAAFVGFNDAVFDKSMNGFVLMSKNTYNIALDDITAGEIKRKEPDRKAVEQMLSGQLVNGSTIRNDLDADAGYRAEQMRKEINAAKQQDRPLDINSPSFQRIMEAQKKWQLRRTLTTPDGSFAGYYDMITSFVVGGTVAQAFIDSGVKKYRFLATIDRNTTDACRNLHNRIFDVDEMKVGINAPPVYPPPHPCRSVIRAIDAAATRNTGKSVEYNPNCDFSLKVDGYSDNVVKGLSDASRLVAELGAKDGKEHLILVDLKTGDHSYTETGSSKEVGSDQFWKFIDDHSSMDFAFVHNHNTDGCFSETDMRTLLTTDNIKVFSAIRIDGVRYLVEKVSKPSTLIYDDLYTDQLEELNKLSRSGKITAGERTRRREEIIVNNLINDYTKGLVELDG